MDAIRLSEIIAEIDALDRVRRGIIRQTISIGSRLGGQLRGALGFHTGLPEKERKAIVGRADRIRKAVLAGEAARADDAAIAAAWAGVILATAEMTAPLDREMAKVKSALAKLARQLPAYDFAKAVPGFGDIGFAVITARCRGINLQGLGDFANPGKIWRRVGVAPTDDIVLHAIGKRPRSDVFSYIYEPVVRAQYRAATVDKETGEVLAPARSIGPYGAVYHEAKARYMLRVAATADQPAKIGEGDKARRNPEKWTPKRADMAARRYMAKRLLKHLWQAWRAARLVLNPSPQMPPSEPLPSSPPGAAEREANAPLQPNDSLPPAPSSEPGSDVGEPAASITLPSGIMMPPAPQSPPACKRGRRAARVGLPSRTMVPPADVSP